MLYILYLSMLDSGYPFIFKHLIESDYTFYT